MDGFKANQGVVIMAATNRPEVLDKALLQHEVISGDEVQRIAKELGQHVSP